MPPRSRETANAGVGTVNATASAKKDRKGYTFGSRTMGEMI